MKIMAQERHLYAERSASASSVEQETSSGEKIDRILRELVQPAGYVRWEYLSRQRLLATAIVRSRRGARARVLDVGCGAGALALTLSEAAGFDVVAMDVLGTRIASVRSRRTARNRSAADGPGLLMADAETLPFREESFDAVVATEVLEHLDEPERLLREVSRVLRPNGRFFMTTPNATALPYRVLRHLPKAAVKKLAASLTQHPLHPELLHDHGTARDAGHPDRHRREGFSLPDLQDLADRAGLRMVTGYTYRIPLPDRLMGMTPQGLSRPLARIGTRPLPLGLQLYAEFGKP